MSRPPSNHAPESPPSMSRVPSYIQFVPKRAMASFDNLVVLANYEERLRDAKKAVWRDRGEKPVEVCDVWECVEHASRGGLRAGSLAFAIRAGINFFLLLTRMHKVPRSYRLRLIRHAVFGEEPLRFAAMIGSFVGLYKLILNALPIVLRGPDDEEEERQFRARLRESKRPATNETILEEESDDMPSVSRVPRPGRLSTSAKAHQEWLHKRTQRWYSVLAGAVAGAIAIRCESSDRRISIAQQMFVRGLQGSYNTISDRIGFRIPNGDVMVFALCCAQIMYGFTMRPDILPRWYNSWIGIACKVSPAGTSINRTMTREGRFSLADIDKIISRSDITPGNMTRLQHARDLATLPTPFFGPPLPPCAAIHPAVDSCLSAQLYFFGKVFAWMFPIYGTLHLIPMVLFKREAMRLKPLKMFIRAFLGTTRSSAFLGIFVIIYHSWLCSKRNMYLTLSALRSSMSHTFLGSLASVVPQAFINFLASKPAYWVGGMMSGFALFFEEKRRRSELAMYVLPRGLEAAWVMLRGKGYAFHTGSVGDVILTSLGMGMVMVSRVNDPEHLSGLVRRILYQFVGPN
ncbi:hypothetical protein BXZ70DRAFT_901280 [Cristinia sonorae]|uniref:Transmembrane protein 135 N-terminal domain-containing protein n=1 Tax=Cristinia sonorae TaxID=1940300 RepID=A0A8K0XKW9_9AGAR|nr:hypothetical protein BXZ70DRAFT_901280 [Cristinia sonorae]